MLYLQQILWFRLRVLAVASAGNFVGIKNKRRAELKFIRSQFLSRKKKKKNELMMMYFIHTDGGLATPSFSSGTTCSTLGPLCAQGLPIGDDARSGMVSQNLPSL